MKRFLLPLAVAAVAAVAASLLPSASATTAPTIIITVRVNVTDSAIRFSQLRVRRGWGVHFVVRNGGKRPHRVDIGGLVTPVIQPGKRGRVSASLEERGRYPFRVTLNGTPRQKGFFIVY
jgi:Cupredoxin-like domain